MLIESLIHPKATKKPTRTVSAHGKDYEFVQVKPGRFVAQVLDEAAQQAFLKLPHLYREFTEELGAAVGALTRTAPATAPAAPAPDRAKMQRSAAQAEAEEAARKEAEKAAAKANAGNDPTVNDLDAAARALLGSTPTAIKRQLDKKPPSVDVAKRAIELEGAAENPRQMVLAHLRAIVSTAEQG